MWEWRESAREKANWDTLQRLGSEEGDQLWGLGAGLWSLFPGLVGFRQNRLSGKQVFSSNISLWAEQG